MELFSLWLPAIHTTQNHIQYFFREHALNILSSIFHNITEPQFRRLELKLFALIHNANSVVLQKWHLHANICSLFLISGLGKKADAPICQNTIIIEKKKKKPGYNICIEHLWSSFTCIKSLQLSKVNTDMIILILQGGKPKIQST